MVEAPGIEPGSENLQRQVLRAYPVIVVLTGMPTGKLPDEPAAVCLGERRRSSNAHHSLHCCAGLIPHRQREWPTAFYCCLGSESELNVVVGFLVLPYRFIVAAWHPRHAPNHLRIPVETCRPHTEKECMPGHSRCHQGHVGTCADHPTCGNQVPVARPVLRAVETSSIPRVGPME